MISDIGNPVVFEYPQKRIYTYPKKKIKIRKITELVVRDSGTHRLKTKNGHLHILPSGWLHIEICTAKKDWTV